MPKQNIYQSQSGPASLRVQPAPRVLSRPDATSSADMLLDAAVKAGMAVVGAFERGREIEERRLIDEALLEHGREFGLWRGDYESSRQGKDALSAQHDFLARSEELAAAKMEEQGERLSPEGRNMLSREFAKRGLYAIEDGGRYQARQTALWNESRLNGQLELFVSASKCATLRKAGAL